MAAADYSRRLTCNPTGNPYTMLELVRHQPDWLAALGVALTRPPGVPERRREEEDPWHPEADAPRPRRIADDLAWLRQAFDEPEPNGLRPLHDTAAVAAWEPDAACSDRLTRLRERQVLDAAGFLLHEAEDAALI
jgi:hypothetical protein